MPRPSRNIDQQLLAAGRELIALTGCRGFSVRQLADRAGVNLGMFHYHFKTRENFCRRALASLYEEMFVQLAQSAAAGDDTVEHLRQALTVMGRFVRDNRPILGQLLLDALAGETLVVEFLAESLNRNLGVMRRLIEQAQAAGRFKPLPLVQVFGLLMGSVNAPILIGGTIAAQPWAPSLFAHAQEELLSDEAIAMRIDLVLSALAIPSASGSPA
jgi:AcrR family transcriptional regulator